MADIPLQQPNKEDIYSFGFSKSLNRGIPDVSTGVVYNPVGDSLNAAQVLSGGSLNLKSLSIGNIVKQASPGDDLQGIIDAVSREGGGAVQLIGKEYLLPNSVITIRRNVDLVGVRPDITVLNFQGTGGHVRLFGEDIYTTGTIVSIVSSVVVTGSGTAWLANVKPGHHLFLGTRWYEIASVLSDTSILLAEGYGDDVTFPSTYRIVKPALSGTIKNISIKNSSDTGLKVTDARKIILDNVYVQDCNKGLVFTNCSEISADRVLGLSCTSNGIEMTNFGLSDWESVNSIANGGSGFVLNNVKTASLFACSASGNTSHGFSFTSVSFVSFFIGATGNGGSGVVTVSGNSDLQFFNSSADRNTSNGFTIADTDITFISCIADGNTVDGFDISSLAASVKLVACISRDNTEKGYDIDTHFCRLIGCSASGNTDDGLEISSFENTVIGGDFDGVDFPDLSIYARGVALSPRDEREFLKMNNNSGGTVPHGAVVVYSPSSAPNGSKFSTTTTNGDNKVIGMVVDSRDTASPVANGGDANILTMGLTAQLLVNNSASSITTGDWLSTYSHAYYAKKAGAGDMAFALALSTPTTSTASISALVVNPRLI